MFRRTSLLLGLTLLAGTSSARAQLMNPIEQERYATCDAQAVAPGGSVQDMDGDTATDFGPFSYVFGATAGLLGANVSVGGQHDSAITSSGISGSASIFGSANGFGEGWEATGFAGTLLRVVFEVPVTAEFSLVGNMSAGDNGIAYGSLQNIDTKDSPYGNLALDRLVTFNVSGLLPAGTYELRFGAGGPVEAGEFLDPDDFCSGAFTVDFQLTEIVPGQPGCFGDQCPCANDDLTAGCANSTGFGGQLTGHSSNSVALDDLVLTATQIPAGTNALFYMGDGLGAAPFFDGKQCAVGNTFRFLGSTQTSTPGGTLELGPGIVADSGNRIQPGLTWHFHAWYRDLAGPCGTGANLTNLYTVTFTP